MADRVVVGQLLPFLLLPLFSSESLFSLPPKEDRQRKRGRQEGFLSSSGTTDWLWEWHEYWGEFKWSLKWIHPPPPPLQHGQCFGIYISKWCWVGRKWEAGGRKELLLLLTWRVWRALQWGLKRIHNYIAALFSFLFFLFGVIALKRRIRGPIETRGANWKIKFSLIVIRLFVSLPGVFSCLPKNGGSISGSSLKASPVYLVNQREWGGGRGGGASLPCLISSDKKSLPW